MNEFFYICQHEHQRQYAIDSDVLQAADERGYNAVTAPITRPSYQTRVLNELSVARRDSNKATSALLSHQVGQLLTDETGLIPAETNARVLWTANTWIDLCSPDPLIRDVSTQVLQQEVSYAAFCGVTNIIVQGPRPYNGYLYHSSVVDFARSLKTAMELAPNVHFNVELPITYNSQISSEEKLGDLTTFRGAGRRRHQDGSMVDLKCKLASWEVWHTLRHVLGYNPRLLVTLTLGQTPPEQFVQNRWFSEPLGCFHLPQLAFVTNKVGVDALSKATQVMLIRSMQLKNPPWILLSEVEAIPGYDSVPSLNGRSADLNQERNPTPAEASTGQAQDAPKSEHIDYFREHLQKKLLQYLPSEMESYGAGWQDYLQNPLQPLTDNLESIQYEVFEKDPIKYEWYERAIGAALIDWKQLNKKPSGPDGRVVVAVTGAGRGPLVTRAINASTSTGIAIDMWALEKNPSAFVLLQRQNQTLWQNQVHLVHSDMRSWSGPQEDISKYVADAAKEQDQPSANSYHIDILVSELLGSFGDNELSPECIDGVQDLLNPAHGISIPQSYSAFLTPIAAPKLYTDISFKIQAGEPNAAHVPYVVMLQATDFLSYDTDQLNTPGERPIQRTDSKPAIREAWTFYHPNKDRKTNNAPHNNINSHNKRSVSLRFECPRRGICHGFAGYFESALYILETSHSIEFIGNTARTAENHESYEGIKRVELSTHPLTADFKSKDMISWFPIYFPLQTPLHVPDDGVIEISMWRQTDGKKVWYEWIVQTFLQIGDGVVKLGDSELHSSIKDACMM